VKWLRAKYPSSSVLVAAPVTKGLLLAVKWTYLEHHLLRHQRKSKEGNCVKLSRIVVLCYRHIRKNRYFIQFVWKTLVLTNEQKKMGVFNFLRKIFNLNFLENALMEFLKNFQSERPTCGPGIVRRFQSLGLDVENIGDT